MLNSQYPIIALAMNDISDANFAVACAEAGIFPSISLAAYYKPNGPIDYHKLVDGLLLFRNARGNSDYFFAMFAGNVANVNLIKLLKAAGVKFLEITMSWQEYDLQKFLQDLENLKNEGFTVMLKAMEFDRNAPRPARNGTLFPHFDIIELKGNRGAGPIGAQSLEEMFFITKHMFPDKQLVATGGIQSKRQLDLYINAGGAIAVGIGTILATSTESKLSDQTKQLMIEANFAKVKQTTYPEKNALVFKPINGDIEHDLNYNISQKIGMKRPDLGGHVYCGEGIDSIHSVLPIREIIQHLV